MSTTTTSPTQALLIHNRRNLLRLRRRWLLIAIAYACIAVGGFVLLRQQWQPMHARRWALLVTLVLGRELWLLWSGLRHNHRENEERLLPGLGYGNAVTLARGLAIALLAGFLFSPRPEGLLAWVPALLYTIVAVLDHLDGWVARVTNYTTKLGEILDMEFDVLGMVAGIWLAIHYGQLPIWYLAIGLAREIFLLGLWFHRRTGRPQYDLPPSMDRRLFAGIQMGFISVMLWPVLAPPLTTFAALLFAFPMVVSFGRDWMVTTGRWSVESAQYKRRRRRAKQLLTQWLPLAVRPVGAGAAFFILAAGFPDYGRWGAVTTAGGLLASPPVLWLWVALCAVAAGAFLLGAMGRTAGLLLAALVCLDAMTVGFSWTLHGPLFFAAAMVIQFGSGRWSFWQPEERILRTRAGEQPTGRDDCP